MNLVKANNGHVIDPWVSNLFDNLFNEGGSLAKNLSKAPAVNILEDRVAYRLDFAVPGFQKEEFKIQVEDNVLSVSGEHKTVKDQQDQKLTRKEFSIHSFERAFTLPELVNTESIQASYKDGILSISLQKTVEEKVAPKQIEVK